MLQSCYAFLLYNSQTLQAKRMQPYSVESVCKVHTTLSLSFSVKGFDESLTRLNPNLQN